MVSVIMPVFNRENTIERAIMSVIHQKYKDWELIVVDDGSTDKTNNIIKQLQKEYTQITLLQNNGKKGVSRARNIGIRHAVGDIIAFLDSDDEWLDNHLEECVIALETTGYQICSALWIEEKYGKYVKIGEIEWYNYLFDNMYKELGIDRNDRYWKFDNRLFEHIVMTDFYSFHINSIVVYKELLVRVGGFDVDMKASEDLDIIYKLLQLSNLLTINSYHFIYHYGKDNIYAFIDREGMDLQRIVWDREIVSRLCYNLKYKIILCKRMKKIISKNKCLERKLNLTKSVNYKLYNRMMSYAYICRKYYKSYAIIITILALRYYKDGRGKHEKIFDFYSDYRERNLYIY